jgi:glutamine amidotransferase PdxT
LLIDVCGRAIHSEQLSPAAVPAAAADFLGLPAAVPIRALPAEPNVDWVLATSYYGEDFVAAVCKGNAMATQFHPEKSGTTGKNVAHRQ